MNAVSQYSVFQLPQWYNSKPQWPSLDTMPTEYYGFALSWPNNLYVPPVFIAQYELNLTKTAKIMPQLCSNAIVYLFGFRLDINKACNSPRDLSGGHVIEFTAVECRSNLRGTKHHLQQTSSAAYSSATSQCSTRGATDVPLSQRCWISHPPSWKESHAYWPFVCNVPMVFLAQVTLPKNKVTAKHLTWNESIYLFGACQDDTLAFAVTTQENSLQTAAEHYAIEDEFTG